ncbi:uncharacterized protein si:dkeyp-113d7.10 isoform X2 [Tachysurus fulvidraco]|uniref:uncharacterized protein si:dkeyp-113d7.10 isoform X2 n=1 Tax=Tachysurus fulvidraco TaxID=1234273 RepID=UPI000F4EC3DE|nr:uncharacterized protein si:dkeyp-113d7.10 isoform X2 [Tachysurus fulvidraco]
MNGALYISFFQGQLESVLEQVVQVAVTEITGTVGGSLSSMLLETARKEQENQRLRDTLQSAGRAERESGETEDPEPQHAASRPAYLHDSVRHEQKRRAVGQLKVVMERVLEFAVRELSKIVEDSFDDVLLELRKTDRENEELMEKLRDSAPPTVISVSQDWVPVLDQVFGQKWCADIWPVKEPGDIKAEQSCFPSEEPIRSDSAPHRKDESQSDRPQWLQDAGALTVNFDTQQTSETRLKEDDVQLKSPSMLHRLLTLPSQLLDGEDESMESEESLLNAITSLHRAQTPHQDTIRADERDGGKDLEDQEELQGEEEEAKPRSCRSGRKNHACKTCGKKFSRAHLLKAHRLTHREAHSPFSKVHTHACNDSGKTT